MRKLKYDEHSETRKPHPVRPLIGRTIVAAYLGRTTSGDDLLTIEFTDGSWIQVVEEGQAGWFSLNHGDDSNG